MYDIIGDIHGHVDPLARLLMAMGYSQHDGVYRHPQRQAIFLGDFIDRGPENRKVLEIVRPMVENGTALAVMGNHEFNAIGFATRHPEQSDRFLRERSETNHGQHQDFLGEFGLDSADHHAAVNWFRRLPLWLDLPGLRIVHACWDPEAMAHVAPYMDELGRVSDAFYIDAHEKGTDIHNAMEIVLKGHETNLTHGRFFTDVYGGKRTRVRTRWWHAPQPHNTLEELTLGPPQAVKAAKGLPVDDDSAFAPYTDPKPVFIGHYWMDGNLAPLTDNVCCVDYSVAKTGGKLAAYRWSGERVLRAENMVATDSTAPAQ